MVPVTSNNHLFSAVIHKKDNYFECVLINKGERVIDKQPPKDSIHHTYESYKIKKEDIKNIIPYFGVKTREEDTAKIYDIFKENSEDKTYTALDNIISRDKIDSNCYCKEIEAGLKYVYSDVFLGFEKKNYKEVKIPKWPIKTKEMQNKIIENIKSQDNTKEVNEFADEKLNIYNVNKEFRDNLKNDPTLVYAKEKELFNKAFNKEGTKTVEECLKLVDIQTFRLKYKFFERMLRENNKNVPDMLFDMNIKVVEDPRDHIISLLQDKNNFKEVAEFLNENFPFVLEQTNYKYSTEIVKKGQEYVKKGNNFDAEKLFSTAIKLNENNISAYEGRGTTLNLMMDFENAKKDLEKVLEIDKNDISYRVLFAESLMASGQKHEALEQYDEILKTDNNNVGIMVKTANILYQLDEEKKALDRYNEILEINPTHQQALFRKLDIVKDLGKPDEILKTCDDILKIAPNNIGVIKDKVHVLFVQNRIEEAVECVIDVDIKEEEFKDLKEKLLKDQLVKYNQMLSKEPENIVTRIKRAELIREIGRKEGAIEAYDDILKVEPENINIMLKKAQILESLKNGRDALNVYDEILKISPKNVDVMIKKASVLRKLGDYEKLMSTYNDILKLNGANLGIIERKARLLEKQGKFLDSINQYKEIQRHMPNNVKLMEKIADMSEKFNYKEEALKQYDKMIKVDKDNVVAMRKRANVLGKMGRKEEAIKQFDAILSEFPRDLVTEDMRKQMVKKINEEKVLGRDRF